MHFKYSFMVGGLIGVLSLVAQLFKLILKCAFLNISQKYELHVYISQFLNFLHSLFLKILFIYDLKFWQFFPQNSEFTFHKFGILECISLLRGA